MAQEKGKGFHWGHAEAVTILAIAVFLALLYLFSAYVHPQAIKELILESGMLGPVVIILMQVIFSVLAPLPNSIPILAAGSLYGTLEGALYAGIGSLFGAALCFWLARALGKEWVAKLVPRRYLSRVDPFVEKYGFTSVFIARLIPLFSFDAVSYGAGLTEMGFGRFMAATGLGMIPGLVLYAFLGASLSVETLELLLAALVLASAVALVMQIEIAKPEIEVRAMEALKPARK